MLSGFRHAEDTARLLGALAVDALSEHATALRTSSAALRTLASFLYGLAGPERTALVASVVDAARRHVDARGEFARECAWAVRLAELYPGDIGVVVALLLNLLVLEEGQAVYLSAGYLHAYLGGVGLEIMANSDNVIRGGLTPKHVDVAELLRIVTFADGPVELVVPRDHGPERVYETPASEFCLSRIAVGPPGFRADERRGAEILLCTDGEVTIQARASLTLRKGASLFVSARDGAYEVAGQGTLFRATVGLM
jgi:mannose-6-phosphate isomerase